MAVAQGRRGRGPGGEESKSEAVGGDLLVALSWTLGEGKRKLDLDVSAVIFDAAGAVVDACYFNKKWVQDGALMHSGDNRFGALGGASGAGLAAEKIRVRLGDMPDSARAVFFLVSAYRGGSLGEATDASVAVDTATGGPPGTPGQRSLVAASFGQLPLGEDQTALLVAFVHRPGAASPWRFTPVLEPCYGFYFTRCLEPMRRHLKAPLGLDDATVQPTLQGGGGDGGDEVFTMTKGEYADLPDGVRYVSVGLGWETDVPLDLDASAVIAGHSDGAASTQFNALRKRELELLDVVWFSQRFDRLTQGRFVQRSLDNLTGAGAGDDELIHIDLDNAPASVAEVTFVVNLYDKNRTFALCKDAYVRLLIDSGTEFAGGREVARFPIDSRISSTGLIFAVLYRKSGGRWGFKTVGEACHGQHVKDEKGDTIDVCLHRKPGLDLEGMRVLEAPKQECCETCRVA